LEAGNPHSSSTANLEPNETLPDMTLANVAHYMDSRLRDQSLTMVDGGRTTEAILGRWSSRASAESTEGGWRPLSTREICFVPVRAGCELGTSPFALLPSLMPLPSNQRARQETTKYDKIFDKLTSTRGNRKGCMSTLAGE
jgi:hypothetical protein